MNERGSKFDSGSKKRERKNAQAALISFQKGAILKHIIRYTDTCETAPAGSVLLAPTSEIEEHLDSTRTVEQSKQTEIHSIVETCEIDWSDVGMWPVPLSNNQQLFVIENPPTRVIPSNFDFPANANNRRFSPSFYTRKLLNGELVNRRWLVYSKSKDCVFCLCCKLFSDSNNKFSKNCFKDWKNISTLIREHETSSKHIDSQRNLIEIEIG